MPQPLELVHDVSFRALEKCIPTRSPSSIVQFVVATESEALGRRRQTPMDPDAVAK